MQESESQLSEADNCDFSEYEPKTVSHFVAYSLVSKTKPIYPNNAIDKKVEGNVSVKILVNKDGNVIKACALNGEDLLKQASEIAVLKWKFKKRPAADTKSHIVDGITFNFSLGSNNEEKPQVKLFGNNKRN